MSVPALFAASVTIVPTAAGSYSVQGSSMDGVAGIDLTIIYDSISLSSPTVSQGALVAGAIMAANTNNPGSIKIAIISTKAFSGSGPIATVTFTTQSGTGGVTSASVSMINSKGAPIPAQVSVSGGNAPTASAPALATAPGVPFSQPGATTTSTSLSTPSAPASPITTTLGTVSMPSDIPAKADTKPADTPVIPAPVTEPAAVIRPAEPPAGVKPASEPQKPDKIKITSYKGTLENFRAYTGQKSPAILIELFGRNISSTIRQEPAPVLSDGKTPVKLLATIEETGNKSPNFALNGARLISLNKDDATHTWIIEALPQAGTMQASLTILTDSETIEYPLTLAPPVEDFVADEAGFAGFLTDSGKATPKHDLNGDGRHDYLDDFIYTANYLKKRGVAGTTKK